MSPFPHLNHESSASPPSTTATASPSTSSTQHPCISCQRRKVKCDRKSPCTRCLTHGNECRQPDVHRTPRRPARKSYDVLGRVRKLEDALLEMKGLLKVQTEANLEKGTPNGSPDSQSEMKMEPAEPLDSAIGQLIIDDDKSRYISTSSWANLVGEVSNLRALLDNDAANEGDAESSSVRQVTAGILRSQDPSSQGSSSNITLDLLWPAYVQNVDPIIKILHMPSVQTLVSGVLSGTHESNRSTDCLFAAIKFGAVTSLTEEECYALGNSRQVLLKTFKAEVLDALDCANFLTSHSFVALQAFVIFLICNRRHEKPRAAWMLSGIAIRLAESLGVHRDGSVMKLPPLVTQLRRSLWWHIRMHDVSCAEDCGFAPTHVNGADARLPLNINDADISSADVKEPEVRGGFTEMTWPLIRFDVCKRIHGFQTYGGRESMGILSGHKQDVGQISQAIADCRADLEQQYLQYCSPKIPVQKVALKVARVMLNKLDLVVQYPLFQRGNSSQIPEDLKKKLSIVSCGIIEQTNELFEDPGTAPLSWLFQIYIHWHPVAFLLNEICEASQPSEHLLRSWKAVNLALTGPHGLDEEEDAVLYKPMETLISRARAKMQSLGLHDPTNEPRDLMQQSNEYSLKQEQLGSSGETNLVPSYNPLGDAGFYGNEFDLYQPMMTMNDFIPANPEMQMGYDESWWSWNSANALNMSAPNQFERSPPFD